MTTRRRAEGGRRNEFGIRKAEFGRKPKALAKPVAHTPSPSGTTQWSLPEGEGIFPALSAQICVYLRFPSSLLSASPRLRARPFCRLFPFLHKSASIRGSHFPSLRVSAAPREKSAFSFLHKAHFDANFPVNTNDHRTFALFSSTKPTSETRKKSKSLGHAKNPLRAGDQAGPAQTRPTRPKKSKIAAARPPGLRPQPKTWQRLLSQRQRTSAGSENNRPLLVSGQRVKTKFWPLSNTCLTQIGPR